MLLLHLGPRWTDVLGRGLPEALWTVICEVRVSTSTNVAYRR